MRYELDLPQPFGFGDTLHWRLWSWRGHGSAIKSTSPSILGRGKSSFGQALFKSVKSTHILHVPEHLWISITLASHLAYLHSFVKPVANNFFTSSAPALILSTPWCRNFCLIGQCPSWYWGDAPWPEGLCLASHRLYMQKHPNIVGWRWWFVIWYYWGPACQPPTGAFCTVLGFRWCKAPWRGEVLQVLASFSFTLFPRPDSLSTKQLGDLSIVSLELKQQLVAALTLLKLGHLMMTL